jgi:thymidylate kinase
MADVVSKQQTTHKFLFTMVARTRRHTELTKKTAKPDGKTVLCQRTFSSVFRAAFFTQLNSPAYLRVYGVFYMELRYEGNLY